MKNRIISKRLLTRSQSKLGRIIVLTGARQTGKTTLTKILFNDYTYISIEDPVVVNSYKSLTASQWNQLYPFAVLDEVQKEPKIVESIKSVYDQFENNRYVLLGSSQILLLKKIKESLVGRCEILELYPLILPEILTNSWEDKIELSVFQKLLLNEQVDWLPFQLEKAFSKKLEVFKYYLNYGAYPALVDEDLTNEDRRIWLNNYIRTYLERDVRDLADFRSLEPFTKVQKLLAINTGQLANFSRIASEASVSPKTAQRFLEYLNISYQTIQLNAWSRNQKKRLVKSPKIHFVDIGIVRALLQKRDSLNGHEFESAIISEIYKQCKSLDLPVNFYHLRTFDGKEIDLLLETEQGYYVFEIKMTENIRSVDARNFKGLEEILDKPILQKMILSNDLHIKDIGDVKAVSAAQFLS
jgi:predicted AAA+ superfamily ATPase